jgi:hypothetical protein
MAIKVASKKARVAKIQADQAARAREAKQEAAR